MYEQTIKLTSVVSDRPPTFSSWKNDSINISVDSIDAMELRRMDLTTIKVNGLPVKQKERSLVMEANKLFTSFNIRCLTPE